MEYCFTHGRVCWFYLSYPGFLTYTLSCTIVIGLCKLQTDPQENKDDYSEQKNETWQQQREWQRSIVGRTELLGSMTPALLLISSWFIIIIIYFILFY